MLVLRPALTAIAAAVFIIPTARHELVPPIPQVRSAQPQCAADNGGISLPSGFCAMIVADNLAQPRHLVVMTNGDLFVSSTRAGVIALRDTTGDEIGRAHV